MSEESPAPLIDERQRFYRMSTPTGSSITICLGGPTDPVVLLLIRPLADGSGIERQKLKITPEETWALWACLVDGIGTAGEPPEWTACTVGPTDANGGPLPPLPGAVPAEPF